MYVDKKYAGGSGSDKPPRDIQVFYIEYYVLECKVNSVVLYFFENFDSCEINLSWLYSDRV